MTEYEKFLEAQKLAKIMKQPAFPKMEVTPEKMEELRKKYKIEEPTPESKERDFLEAYGSFEEYEKSHTSSPRAKIVQNIINSIKPIQNQQKGFAGADGRYWTPAPDPTPSKLIKSLTDNQQSFLFNKLTESGLFMPIETDYNSFCFVFGNSIKPDEFIPLQWLQNRQLLRELITELKHPDIEITKNKYTLPAFFIDKKNNSIIELPTNTPKGSNLSTKIQEISKNLRQTK